MNNNKNSINTIIVHILAYVKHIICDKSEYLMCTDKLTCISYISIFHIHIHFKVEKGSSKVTSLWWIYIILLLSYAYNKYNICMFTNHKNKSLYHSIFHNNKSSCSQTKNSTHLFSSTSHSLPLSFSLCVFRQIFFLRLLYVDNGSNKAYMLMVKSFATHMENGMQCRMQTKTTTNNN